MIARTDLLVVSADNRFFGVLMDFGAECLPEPVHRVSGQIEYVDSKKRGFEVIALHNF